MRFSLTRLVRARGRLLTAVALALVAATQVPSALGGIARALLGWNVFVYVYLALVWTMMRRSDEHRLRRLARLMDETAVVVLTLVTIGAVMSLLAIVAELATAKQVDAGRRALQLGLTGSTVIGSWLLVPTAFALHYAFMFYRAPEPVQLAFPDGEREPGYVDFLYFSFTIAVASQTADVALRSRAMRRVVLVQSVLSFFFNTSIVAMSVNIAASLAFPGS
ncbi:MAG TPA: DUF1345 domain-containing protein [Burkholderiaceae bacterium]|nr:DUF1345 domain-containing protein [Burkholderiaceae bacterium]